MIKFLNNNNKAIFLLLFVALVFTNCERDLDELEEATNPTTGEVFIDAFSSGLEYAAFAGSDVTAFEVDIDVKYAGDASMRIAVPDFEDPRGAFAGGVYFTEVGRDLTEYNVLTFWAKASQAANIDLIGFGNDLDLGDNVYEASITNVPVTTNWKQYYIPIPEASKLTDEKGMFFYSEGPENGRGYTIWFDEVKFETLSTVAYASAQIMGGQDVSSEAETGNTFTVDAVSVFNLPSGVNQTVQTASAYFTFESSNPTVASVNDMGIVNVLDEGTAVITAKLGEIEAEGSLTIVSSGNPVLPATAAPTPEQEAEDVISIFSNAYTDVPVDYYNGFWEFSTTDNQVVQVDGDDIMRYMMLNFVGIQFTAPTQDISQMTHFHMDIWTPDATDLPNAFKVLLVDLGPDNSFDGNDNSSHEITITSPTLKSEEWISIDLPLTEFPGLTGRMNLAQIVLSGDIMNVFADNIYFYKDENGGSQGPLTGAPTPDDDPANVISIFSDSYTNVPDTDFFPNWGQATVVTQESIDGNNTLKYSGLNYQGVQLANPLDVSGMEFLHIDYWTDNASALSTFLISSGPVEMAVPLNVPTNGWSSIEIPLSDFTGVDLADIIQFKFEGTGTVYLDNIYFYREGGGGGEMGPQMAAPMPDEDQANVISIFSDSYANVPDTDFFPNWGQATVVTQELIDGNNTLKYENLNYQGTQLANSLDVSSMEFLHLDYWTDDASALSTFLISSGPVETAYVLSVPTNGWNSVDIPLTDFAGVDLADVIQFKFEGDGTIYLDNIYFYREGGGGGGMGPQMAAPMPDEDEANVISIFSDSYTNITGSNLNPNWGQGTVVTEELIDGNNTLKYTDLNFQGLELAGATDVSSMEFLHLDYWSDNASSFSVFLISPGPVETAVALNVPTSGWNSIDIPLTDFAGVDLANVIQFKFEGDGTVYLDNIYFYREDGGAGGGDPDMAAPDPTLPASNVISLFSNVYNDVVVDTWRTEWSSADLEDIQIDGNDTKKYSNLDFVGIETVANTIDASEMTHIHIDVWSSDFTFFGIKIVDFGADGAFGGGDDVEHQINITDPMQNGWNQFDLDLTDFTGLTTKANLAQFILVGQPTGMNTIFVDNVYLHN